MPRSTPVRSLASPPSAPPLPDHVGVAAVNRALSILRAFSKDSAALSLAQLAERTGLYKSTILRLAESLEAFGYLGRSATGAFTLGPAPMRLAAVYQTGLHPAETVMPVLRELAQATSESAAFYVRSGSQRLCAYRVGSPRAIGDNLQAGDMLPLDRGAAGHVLLAFAGARGASYERVRADLISVTLGERDRETAAIACPVFGVAQRLEGALSLSGPVHRFTPSAIKRMRRDILAAARRLTAALGGDTDTLVAAARRRGAAR